MWRALPLALVLSLPLSLSAQTAEEGEEEPEEEQEVDAASVGVFGGPLDLSHLGKRPSPPPPPLPPEERFERSPGWGIRETPLHLAPAGEGYGRTEGEIRGYTSPPWPGRAMEDAWDLASAYSFPRLAPAVGVEFFTSLGERQTDDLTLFGESVRLSLYFLELRMNAVKTAGGERLDETELDLDFRIPVRLGRAHRLAFLPGATFPIDGRPRTDRDTAVRFQAIYGIGVEGFGAQGRLGFAEGRRARGVLQVDDRVDDPAVLYGALVAWRFVPGVQIRAEASGEIGTDDGEDLLSLLGGPVFFPFGDPRLSVGVLGVLETTGDDLDFERPVWGGLVQLGLDFL